jgi:hypothetical protein
MQNLGRKIICPAQAVIACIGLIGEPSAKLDENSVK